MTIDREPDSIGQTETLGRLSKWIAAVRGGPRLIRTQLYLGIGGAVALTIAAGLVGLISFEQLRVTQSEITEVAVPDLTSAFALERFSGNLEAAGPAIVSADNEAELGQLIAAVDAERAAGNELLEALDAAGSVDAEILSISQQLASLNDDIGELESLKVEALQVDRSSSTLSIRIAGLRDEIRSVLVPAIDDQLFFLSTGYRELADIDPQSPPDGASHLNVDQLGIYRSLVTLQTDVNIAVQLIASAFIVADADAVEPLRERFEAAIGRAELSMRSLRGSPVFGLLTPGLNQLSALALAEDGGFDLIDRRLRLVDLQADALARSRRNGDRLSQLVNARVENTQAQAAAAADQSARAIGLGRTLLVLITIISAGGAVTIAVFYVGRIISRRIGQLSGHMRRLAGGELETSLTMQGQDEITDMAEALEVFRRHALEVQRLNLVEELAAEIQRNNEALQSALAELQQAQQQIISSQKLAALGELTAAVAHEIRNPLNFVKNFSEASEDLIEELSEIIDDVGESVDEENRGLLAEIAGDLTANLQRIRSHGNRAELIVTNMLQMGRARTGEQVATNLNDLITVHAKLAYQGARTRDPDLSIDMVFDLDSEMGEVAVIPQDVGRVFLNLVGNACDAVDSRWRPDGGSGVRYPPGEGPNITVTSKREPDSVRVTVRDNGGGIAKDAIDKIFNPFFTTKPPDRGTGLGLSISNDIITSRLGELSVDSVVGEYTEFRVSFPLQPPPDEPAGPQ